MHLPVALPHRHPIEIASTLDVTTGKIISLLYGAPNAALIKMMDFELHQAPVVVACPKVLLALMCLASCLPLTATTIFDNSVNPHASFSFGRTGEAGDQIRLAGTARLLTNFSFRYFLAPSDPAPHVAARVRLYLNDGPIGDFDTYATPGTVLYDSDWFGVTPTFTGRFVFSAGAQFPAEGLFLPSSEITWSIAYQGLASGEAAGVFIYSPPVVGEDDPQYFWMNVPGIGWYRQTSRRGETMDFEAILEATEVPEPATLTLSTFSLVLIGLRALNQKVNYQGHSGAGRA